MVSILCSYFKMKIEISDPKRGCISGYRGFRYRIETHMVDPSANCSNQQSFSTKYLHKIKQQNMVFGKSNLHHRLIYNRPYQFLEFNNKFDIYLRLSDASFDLKK